MALSRQAPRPDGQSWPRLRRALQGVVVVVATAALAGALLSSGCGSGDRDKRPVGTTEPQTTITAGPSGTTGDDTPTFKFSSDAAGSDFECRVDSDDFDDCSSPHTTDALSDGEHTFKVRAIAPADSVDPRPARRTFTVDGDRSLSARRRKFRRAR